MKKLFLLLFALPFLSSNAQVQDPVHWSAVYTKLSATEGEITITASIDKGWHTYSQKAVADGPIPTSFTIVVPNGHALNGPVAESPAHEEFVPAFGATIAVFSAKAEFKQKVKTNGKAGQPITIKIEYMCCNDMMCLPPKMAELSVKTQ